MSVLPKDNGSSTKTDSTSRRTQTQGTEGFYRTIIDNNLFRPLGWRPPRPREPYRLLGTILPKDTNTPKQAILQRTTASSTNTVSKSLTALLTDPSVLARYRDVALRKGRSFTWEAVAKALKNQFISLQERVPKDESTRAHLPSFFQYHYDTIQGKTTPAAYERPEFIREDVKSAIVKELMQTHSINQVSVVLEYICESSSTAEEIRKYLSIGRVPHE